MNPVRHTILGIFFLGTLVVLGTTTIYLGEFRWMSERTEYPVFFEDVKGLRPGDPVLVYGVPMGSVASVEFTEEPAPEQRLRVVLAMDRPVDLRTDHRIDISDQSLLGGKRVEVELAEVHVEALAQVLELRGSRPGQARQDLGVQVIL